MAAALRLLLLVIFATLSATCWCQVTCPKLFEVEDGHDSTPTNGAIFPVASGRYELILTPKDSSTLFDHGTEYEHGCKSGYERVKRPLETYYRIKCDSNGRWSDEKSRWSVEKDRWVIDENFRWSEQDFSCKKTRNFCAWPPHPLHNSYFVRKSDNEYWSKCEGHYKLVSEGEAIVEGEFSTKCYESTFQWTAPNVTCRNPW